MNIQIKAAEIARIAEQLRSMCGDDEKLFSDMIEGESDLHWIVSNIHEAMALDVEMMDGIDKRQADLKARKERLERRMEARRDAILSLMKAGQQTKLELPEATFSVRGGKDSLSVVDAQAIPSEWMRVKSEANKVAINAAFKDADKLPNWLVREPAKDSLSIRVK